MVCLFVLSTHIAPSHNLLIPHHGHRQARAAFPVSLSLNKSCECITFLYSPNTMIKSEEETLISPRRYQEPWVSVNKHKTWSLHLPCLMLKKCLHCEKWTCRGDNEIPGELATWKHPAKPDTFSWIIGNNIIKSTGNYLIFSNAILALLYLICGCRYSAAEIIQLNKQVQTELNNIYTNPNKSLSCGTDRAQIGIIQKHYIKVC